MSKQLQWVREELVLALELYFQKSPADMNQHDPGVVALSKFLTEMSSALHSRYYERSNKSVYMKLCNFMFLDPYGKNKGLGSGSSLGTEVWNQYADDRESLEQETTRILETLNALHEAPKRDHDDEYEMPEGRLVTRTHKMRERNPSLVKRKKESVLKKEKTLSCEVCGFDFYDRYGEHGKGFIECHHTVPVSELNPKSTTKLKDLALVCANCHRMLHRIRPWPTIAQLKNILR